MPIASIITETQLHEIRRLCESHYVARLELFGSAARGEFKKEGSDLDFLIRFKPVSPAERANAYFGMLAALQDLFHREIDLVEAEAVTNPFLMRTINADRTVLYAA
jgi:predicted nucleotidyltransferase